MPFYILILKWLNLGDMERQLKFNHLKIFSIEEETKDQTKRNSLIKWSILYVSEINQTGISLQVLFLNKKRLHITKLVYNQNKDF